MYKFYKWIVSLGLIAVFCSFVNAQGLRKFDTAKVVGADRCTMCHFNEGQAWKKTAHYKTFSDLHKRARAKSILGKLGITGNIKKKGSCRNCHYTIQHKKAISGISCESCHGPAKDWLMVHNQSFMPKEKRYKKVDAAGMIRPKRIYHVVENCYQCHTIPNERLVNVGGHVHNSPAFLFPNAFNKNIRHNFLSGGGRNKELSPQKKRIFYVVGIGLEFEYALRGFAMATKKAKYSLRMSKKMRMSQINLIDLYKKTKIPELRKMKSAVSRVIIKLNNKEAFLEAAEKVKAANIAFVNRYTGNEPELVKLDQAIKELKAKMQAAKSKNKSLYQRIGGAKAVSAAVDVFYAKVLKDNRIKHFFAGVDMQRQKKKQRAFLTMVFGGPSHYSGKDLRNAHKHLKLKDSHFNAVVELLAQTLKELGVKKVDINEVAKIAESVRGDVLNKKKSLYDRIGGAKAVNAAVDVFYAKVLKDKRIKHFFDGIDMQRQKMKQRAFLTMVFGGPSHYTGKDLRKGHKHLNLKDSHFNAVVELLAQTLKELGVKKADINEVAKIAESVRKDVLNQ